MNDRQYKDEDTTELELSKSDIVLPVNIEGMEEAYRRFQQVKSKLMIGDLVKYNQYGYIAKPNEDGKEYIVKSGWRKIATAFNISIDMNIGTPQKIYGEDKEGKYYTWLFPIRAIAPNGKYIDSVGACSSRKAFFSKKNNQRIDPQEEDIILMAQTVGINRAISDLVGGGEVSGEEMAGKTIHSTPNPEPTMQPQQQQSNEFDWSKIDLDKVPDWYRTGKKAAPAIVKRLFSIAKKYEIPTEEFQSICKNITEKEHSYLWTYGNIKEIEEVLNRINDENIKNVEEIIENPVENAQEIEPEVIENFEETLDTDELILNTFPGSHEVGKGKEHADKVMAKLKGK